MSFNPKRFRIFSLPQQEVTRAHQGWALDSVSQRNKVTTFTSPSEITEPPPEGVYVYGLNLEGASWDSNLGCLRESDPKILYEPLPVLHVYAIQSTSGKSHDMYECPVYKKPTRTDLTYITSMDLRSERKSSHWILRGVALLSDIK